MRASLVISFAMMAAVAQADPMEPNAAQEPHRDRQERMVRRKNSFELKAECEKWAAELRANPVKNDGVTSSVHFECFPAGTDPRKPG